ncbi:hypothetical protein WICMUC_004057 [Wickerhamomyces mucosus]|uniref:Genetic interactor of prohibitins 3, mitochondrial n=1 Tax=Wickerhamomyces mucosus TaxID=1378264 RepID=A0A9P8PJT2_9ASCO|nr:hypothetical protein WICMUC_004057 [Wickerhamomyces mucosus]
MRYNSNNTLQKPSILSTSSSTSSSKSSTIPNNNNNIPEGEISSLQEDNIYFDKVHNCASCGVQLQNENPKEMGYFIQPKPKQSNIYKTSKNFQFFQSQLSPIDEETQKLLQNNDQDIIITSNKKVLSRDKIEELICKRCHDALHHSIYNISENKPLNFEEILSTIPTKSTVYHIFSAYDFPLSLMNIPKRTGEVNYVMNKVDMLFSHGSTMEKYDKYFKRIVKRLTGYKQNIFLISAHTKWGLNHFLQKLDRFNYLLGYVNTGKTRLANRIRSAINYSKGKNYELNKPLGSSYFPALTRDHIQHKLNSKTLLVDTPGFLDQYNVFNYIKPQYLKHFIEGKKSIVSELRYEKYKSVIGGQVFTNGGVFLLIPPKDTILQIKSICQGEPKIFSNLAKAIDIIKNQPESLEKFIAVKPNAADEMVRYVIPPFLGTIDLLIKDIGYVQIRPTGAKTNDDLFEVWAPKGVILGVRETIEHFLTGYIKELGTKQKKIYGKGGTVKVKREEKLRFKPKSIPDYKIFSKLYQIPNDCTNPWEEMERQYNQHIKENGETFWKWDNDDFRDESRNKYWIEKL